MSWHYEMILVKKAVEDYEEDEGRLVEVYLEDDGSIMGFAFAHLVTIGDLELAYKDVSKQGGKLNTWFYDRGKFSWVDGELEYEPNEEDLVVIKRT